MYFCSFICLSPSFFFSCLSSSLFLVMSVCWPLSVHQSFRPSEFFPIFLSCFSPFLCVSAVASLRTQLNFWPSSFMNSCRENGLAVIATVLILKWAELNCTLEGNHLYTMCSRGRGDSTGELLRALSLHVLVHGEKVFPLCFPQPKVLLGFGIFCYCGVFFPLVWILDQVRNRILFW